MLKWEQSLRTFVFHVNVKQKVLSAEKALRNYTGSMPRARLSPTSVM